MPLFAALFLLTAPTIEVAPVAPVRVVAPFVRPATEYGPGHRGVDLAASRGQLLRSPITGTVVFAGRVAGKDVVTVSDGTRMVSLEPAVTVLSPGTMVIAGQFLGVVGRGGHCDMRCLHIGLRVGGVYLPPLRLRAHLVP